jgi:hypothetical protein
MSPKGVPGRRGQKRPRDHHIAAPRASARVSSASRTDTPRWISAMPGPGRPCCEWPVTWSRRAARSGWPRPAGRCQDHADHGAGPESLRGTLVASVYRAGRPRRTGHGTGQRAGEAATRLDAAGAATRRSALCASPGWRRQARRSPRRARPRKLHRSGCGSKPGSQPAEQQAPGQAVGDAGPANPARPPAGSRLASAHPAGGAAVDTARFRGRRSASGDRPDHVICARAAVREVYPVPANNRRSGSVRWDASPHSS